MNLIHLQPHTGKSGSEDGCMNLILKKGFVAFLNWIKTHNISLFNLAGESIGGKETPAGAVAFGFLLHFYSERTNGYIHCALFTTYSESLVRDFHLYSPTSLCCDFRSVVL